MLDAFLFIESSMVVDAFFRLFCTLWVALHLSYLILAVSTRRAGYDGKRQPRCSDGTKVVNFKQVEQFLRCLYLTLISDAGIHLKGPHKNSIAITIHHQAGGCQFAVRVRARVQEAEILSMPLIELHVSRIFTCSKAVRYTGAFHSASSSGDVLRFIICLMRHTSVQSSPLVRSAVLSNEN